MRWGGALRHGSGRSPVYSTWFPIGVSSLSTGYPQPGEWRVTLQHPGFGSKRSVVTVDPAKPHPFRLLSDSLLGYAWPKWVRAGESAEFRVHSPEMYQLELWRYGWKKELVRSIGWFDEHGPRATMQITPDGDYTQTGAQWNLLMAASIMMIMPLLVVFFLGQRYFVEGITLTGLKG